MQKTQVWNHVVNVSDPMKQIYSFLIFCVFIISCGKTSPVQDIVTTISDDDSCVVGIHTIDTTYSQQVIEHFNKSTSYEQHPEVSVESSSRVHISKEYQEGYDAGYDDGEDDALSRNGYEGQYDDSCRYKGKKRKDYQLGYAEGYEAGFYDNVDDNGDDEEYE